MAKIKEITSEHILFDDGVEITYFHDQDCCENVYADFEALKTTSFDWEHFDTDKLELKKIPEVGIKLRQYLIPCYNKQNGYYSGDLSLIIKRPNKENETIDITGNTVDIID